MAKIIVRYVGKKQNTATRVKAIVRLLISLFRFEQIYPLKQYLSIKIILSRRVRMRSQVIERSH
jgi:hypothetical protein